MVTPRGTSPRGLHGHTRSNSNASQLHVTPRQMLQNSLRKSASQVSLSSESVSLPDSQRSSSFTAATTSNPNVNPAHDYKTPRTPDDVAGLSAMAMDTVAAGRAMPPDLLEAMTECDACHLRMHPDEMRDHETFCASYHAEFGAKVLEDSRCVVCAKRSTTFQPQTDVRSGLAPASAILLLPHSLDPPPTHARQCQQSGCDYRCVGLKGGRCPQHAGQCPSIPRGWGRWGWPVQAGGGPARRYRLGGATGLVPSARPFISPCHQMSGCGADVG